MISDLLQLLGIDSEELFQLSHLLHEVLRDVRLGPYHAEISDNTYHGEE